MGCVLFFIARAENFKEDTWVGGPCGHLDGKKATTTVTLTNSRVHKSPALIFFRVLGPWVGEHDIN
eukprot:scaffold85139_cov20-Tisochrysis_lutea.AAC.1